jgi:pyridinium-3,5-bisthiocarboxylic acid mononucleotide nickel chelatase
VGAVDAIVDVTGAVVALDLLGVESVHVSALPLGGGWVDGPHGKIPVPGPGTVELLRGFPVVDPGIAAELVTPTGAAILTTLAAGSGRMPAMTIDAVGYGAGTMELAVPNVLRCLVGETSTAATAETVAQVETTIDDMSPQLYEPLMDRLFAVGALDVFLAPVVMKRSRPGVVLTALCPPATVREVTRVLFEESSTIGVRWSTWERARLEREMVSLSTAYGTIPFKVSRLDGRVITVTPEFSEVVRIAGEKALPVREVLDQARADGRKHLSA